MAIYTRRGSRLYLKEPLKQARIIERPNRFVIYAELHGRVVKCHSPVTGRIGGFTLTGLPCLLSGPHDLSKRSTEYTVEAIGFEEPERPSFQWVAINQGAGNRYFEALFAADLLSPLLPAGALRREVRLGSSRVDFLLYEDLYLEVKMPLLELAVAHHPALPYKDFGLGSDSPRFLQQLEDLMAAMAEGKRAGQVTVFGYEATGPMERAEQLARNITTHPVLHRAEEAGLERWRLDLRLTPEYFEALSFEPVTP